LAIPSTRTICVVERESQVIEVLAQRMEEGFLDSAPVWTDFTTFDGRPWNGAVDLIVAGVPCTPVSVAGKQLGEEDERWLWPHLARVLRETNAPWLFLENVPGIFRNGENPKGE